MNANDNPVALAKYLDDLSGPLQEAQDGDERWKEVASAARSLADALRTRSGSTDIHGKLGSSSLPKVLALFVRGSPGVNGVPSRGQRVHALYETLRVGANLSMDHDANRALLLAADFPQNVLALLDSYLPFIGLPSEDDSQSREVQPLQIDDIRVIKTAIGVLLNMSAGYDPAREKLISLGAPLIVLRVICGIYPAGSWASTSSSIPNAKEEWQWRSGVSNWGWRALDEWRESSPDGATESVKPILDASSMPYLLAPLTALASPFPSQLPSHFSSATARQPLIEADLEVLEQVCMFLESLALDVQDVRLVLGRSSTPREPAHAAYLSQIARFVEDVSPAPYWADCPEKDRKRWEKTLVLCKAAAVKSIIAVSGEDSNLSLLWNDGDQQHGGWFVQTMLKWIRDHQPHYNVKDDKGWDDMAICATLALGNLARKDAHCLALVRPPMSVVEPLVPLLDRRIDIKLKHGVIGLLKNISQVSGNRSPLGKAGILEALASSQVWDKRWDLAETVQLSAIGVSKHLCQTHAPNSLRLVTPPESDHESGLEQILALARRSDTIAVKSEGTRVLVNVVKSLCHSTDGGPIADKDRRDAIDCLVNSRSTAALSELIGRSQKYPVLLNEGIVALTLLGSQPGGASYVLSALFSSDGEPSTTPTPTDSTLSGSAPMSPSGSSAAPVLVPDSPTVAMLVTLLVNKDSKFPPELRANVCSLLAAIGRTIPGVDTKRQEALRNQTWDTLQRVADGPETGVAGRVSLKKAAGAALEAWR